MRYTTTCIPHFLVTVKGAIRYEIYFSVCAHSGLLFSGRGAARRAAAAGAYGLVLLLAALNFGFVKLDDVKEVGIYLTGIFPLLFVPAAAGVMELWAEMGNMLLPIIIAIIPVTVLVMVSAGRTTQAMTGRKKKEADHAE